MKTPSFLLLVLLAPFCFELRQILWYLVVREEVLRFTVLNVTDELLTSLFISKNQSSHAPNRKICCYILSSSLNSHHAKEIFFRSSNKIDFRLIFLCVGVLTVSDGDIRRMTSQEICKHSLALYTVPQYWRRPRLRLSVLPKLSQAPRASLDVIITFCI